MWGVGLRLAVAFAWLVAGFIYLRAYKLEHSSLFRQMRIYAMLVAFAWGIWEGYIAIYGGILEKQLPVPVTNGSITLGLLVPTVSYFVLSGWITHRVVRDYIPPDPPQDDARTTR